MTTLRVLLRSSVLFAAALAAAVPARAQEEASLTRAKAYYASAAYEDALQVLRALRDTTPASEALEVAAYQTYCLVALGRSDEARTVIESIVRANPRYLPSASEVSPRVREFFDEVRQPLIGDMARELYTTAKDAYDRKDMPVAATGFGEVLSLLDAIGDPDNRTVKDLRTLATGFGELAKAAVAAATPEPEPPPEPEPIRIYSQEDADVTRPVVLTRPMPNWQPNAAEALMDFRGVLELIVDESGRVQSASLIESVNARYDPLLIRAAQDWTFKPAMKDGAPVKFRYRLGIHLNK